MLLQNTSSSFFALRYRTPMRVMLAIIRRTTLTESQRGMLMGGPLFPLTKIPVENIMRNHGMSGV